MRPRLVVAALSARMLAESARAAGCEVVALDVFGDRDTRAAAADWRPIGAGLRIDAAQLVAALRGLDADGWIAGAGIEPHLAEACAAAPQLPLLGNAPAVVAAVRDPRDFFAALAALGLDHPPTRFDAPPEPDGWLRKDFDGSGGWHIHHAASGAATDAGAGLHWQRELAAEALSALFVADGRGARVVGLQRPLVRPLLGRPHVFHGVVGPVDVAAPLRAAVERAVAALAAHYALRGLNSLDGLQLAGDRFAVLELNPRPSASMALYDRAGSMLQLHLDACRGAAQPLAAALPPPAGAADGVRGHEIVFADRDRDVDPARLAARPWCHDVAAAPLHAARGDPLCSVSAAAADERGVREQLAARRHDVLSLLEPSA